MPKVFFRLDASSTIGAGHAVRSGALMQVLAEKGWDVVLVTGEESLTFLPSLQAWPVLSPEAFEADAAGDVLVVDHYGIDAAYEARMRRRMPVVVMDDLAEVPHACDMLINTTLKDPARYRGLVPEGCQFLMGPAYVLLRRVFAEKRKEALAMRQEKSGPIHHVVVTMGGGDTREGTQQALQLLESVGFAGEVHILTGFKPFTPSFEKTCREGKVFQCFFHHAVDPVPFLMRADVALGAAGTSSFERATLGVPQFVIPLYDNQKEVVAYFPSEDFPAFWKAPAAAMRDEVDGLGAERVAAAIIDAHAAWRRPREG